ncbi:isatin hydrolase-like [Mytilus californianus]|uniref:isatin hydrolase-like n=1 Tax=Mytilus californianus TaxID=6549 RepID=UPI002245E06F|nr:isatin hydrolase-like [Mytilus californianus]
MGRILMLTLVTYVAVCVSCLEYQVVDLTHNHGKDSIYWPTHSGYERYIDQRGIFEGTNIWVASNTIKTTEHLGTHLDAPQHFNEFSWTTHQIPIENLVGPGVIVNVKSKVVSSADYTVTKADLEEWEDQYGKIPDGAIVLMNSGWHDRYPDKTRVFNTQNPNDTTSFHFPSWGKDAVSWLLAHRSIHVLGVDVPSLDYGQSKDFPVHILISQENIPGLENVGYLDKIPESGTIISCAVMKIVDGSGSPARVFALIPKNSDTNDARKYNCSLFLLLCSLVSFKMLNE